MPCSETGPVRFTSVGQGPTDSLRTNGRVRRLSVRCEPRTDRSVDGQYADNPLDMNRPLPGVISTHKSSRARFVRAVTTATCVNAGSVNALIGIHEFGYSVGARMATRAV